jgi:hypothetical protein
MKSMRIWIMAAGASLTLAAHAEGDNTQSTQQTSAAHGIETGSGTNSYPSRGSVVGSDGGQAGGTTIGSGADTLDHNIGVTVDEGTVMRRLTPQGDAAPPVQHRRQIYGLNPRADDSAPAPSAPAAAPSGNTAR